MAEGTQVRDLAREDSDSSQPTTNDNGRSIAVVIPTFRRPKDLQALLVSLSKGTRIPDEVIVVDNDETRSAFPEPVDRLPLRVIHGGHGLAVSTARNTGWRAATSELCFFIDDDNIVEPDAISGLSRAFDSGNVGLAAPVIYAGDTGTIWCGGVTRSRWTSLTRNLLQGETTLPAQSTWSTEDMPDAFAVPRDVMEAVNGFDERLFPFYYEEADLGFRIRERNLRAIVFRDVQVRHYGFVGTNSGEAMVRAFESHGARRVRQMSLSRLRFHRLHTHGVGRVTALGLFIPIWMLLTWAQCLSAKAPVKVRLSAIVAVTSGVLAGYRELAPSRA